MDWNVKLKMYNFNMHNGFLITLENEKGRGRFFVKNLQWKNTKSLVQFCSKSNFRQNNQQLNI